MKKSLIKNSLLGLMSQIVIIVLGFVIPLVMIDNYGSDINGLVNTISQIFAYMSLLEAGIGQAAKNALYKPIANKNESDVSYIASIAQNYYRKLTLYYGIGVLLLSIVSPFILKTNVDHITIALVVLIEGISGVISFFFIETYATILSADGKNYVNNEFTLINKVLSYTVKIIMASLGFDIVLIQIIYLMINILRVVFYQVYMKKHYSWINYHVAHKNDKLNDRRSYVITEISSTVFLSVDVIVISTFISTQIASVYSIYNMIFFNLSQVLNSVYFSIIYVLGQTFYRNPDKYEKLHDTYTSVFLGTMTILMSVAYVLCIPFVKIYTQGVADINYVYSQLPLLFCLVQIISWSRYVSGNLTGVAGYAKPTSYISLVETLLNIILSIFLVNKYGIVGVLLATVVALPLKVIWCVYIADKKVLHRSFKKTVLIFGVNYLFFATVVFVNKIVKPPIVDIYDIICYGVILICAFSTIGMGLNLIVNPDILKLIRKLKK